MPYPIRTQPTSNFSISREKHLESISERSYGNRDYSGGRGYGDRYGADHGARATVPVMEVRTAAGTGQLTLLIVASVKKSTPLHNFGTR